jgi:glycosyltransferase involved in cell wall biosynthesis
VKLLLVTNIFPPDIGGPATFIDRLGRALAQQGHRVTVVCTSEMPRVAEDRDRPFRVRRIPRRNPLEYHAWLRATLLTALAGHRRCLINGLEDVAAPLARRVGCRYLVKIVGDKAWEQGRNKGLVFESVAEFQARQDIPPPLAAIRRRRAAWLPGAAGVVVPSEYLKGLVTGWGIPTERIHVIRNGVSLDGNPPPLVPRRPDDPLRVVFVGRLTNFKGVETLLLALARVTGVEAGIIGDGPAEPLLRALAGQLQLDGRAYSGGDSTRPRCRPASPARTAWCSPRVSRASRTRCSKPVLTACHPLPPTAAATRRSSSTAKTACSCPTVTSRPSPARWRSSAMTSLAANAWPPALAR